VSSASGCIAGEVRYLLSDQFVKADLMLTSAPDLNRVPVCKAMQIDRQIGCQDKSAIALLRLGPLRVNGGILGEPDRVCIGILEVT
jgi:hypothetical protein